MNRRSIRDSSNASFVFSLQKYTDKKEFRIESISLYGKILIEGSDIKGVYGFNSW
jgi:hypothetical protein